MKYYEYTQYQTYPIAQPIVGFRVPSAREQELYEGIDREIARIKIVREMLSEG